MVPVLKQFASEDTTPTWYRKTQLPRDTGRHNFHVIYKTQLPHYTWRQSCHVLHEDKAAPRYMKTQLPRGTWRCNCHMVHEDTAAMWYMKDNYKMKNMLLEKGLKERFLGGSSSIIFLKDIMLDPVVCVCALPEFICSSSSPLMMSLGVGSEESDQVIGEEPHKWGQHLHKELWGSTFVAPLWEHWRSGSQKPPRRPTLEPPVLALCPWTFQPCRTMENKFLLCRIWTSPRNIPE